MSKRLLWTLTAAAVWLFGCRLLTPPTAQAPTSTSQTPALEPESSLITPAAVLTRVHGDVRLQQRNASQATPASFGDYLWQGDVILTGQEARAEAVCSDGMAIQVEPNNEATVTCGETPDPVYQRVILRTHSGQIETLPATRLALPEYGDLPIVWSPRNTRIASRQPEIWWLGVEQAEEYEVIVRSPSGALWQVTTTETELPYPEAQPALEHGSSYIVQVTAQLDPAEQPRASKEVLITVLSAADMEQVQQVEAQVEALGLSRESARLFLSGYYVDLQMYDAAIRELDLLCEETLSPLAFRLRGDAYLAVELDEAAIESYREAVTLAQEQGSQLIEAESEVGLGHVSYATGDYDRALDHYQAALALYQELGVEESAAAVAELAAHTETLLPTPEP